MHSIVNKIWTLNDKTQRIEVFVVNETMMKFRILNQADKHRVLRRGMWNLAGVPVVMTKWSPVVEKEKPPPQSIPMWIHVKHVPLKMFSWQGLSYLTSPLGVPGRLHPETAQCLNLEVAKVFVNVDLTKDLPKKMKFNIEGEEVLVEYNYPWLPKKCEKCGKWGHSEKICVVGRGKAKEKLEEGEIKEVEQEKNKEELPEKVVNAEEINEVTQREESDGREEVTQKEITTVGEITPERNKEWSEVSPGKASRSPRELEFGQVSILTKSRFSVLTPVDEGEMPEIELDKEEPLEEEMEVVSSEEEVEEKEDDLIIQRQRLPRESKLNHRYLKGGQKTQDANPSYLKRKKPRRQ